jgi:hypothetical protein
VSRSALEVEAWCPSVLQSLGPSAHPLGVDDLAVEEASANELGQSRIAHSFFMVVL